MGLEIEAVFEVMGAPAINGVPLDEWVATSRMVRIVGPIDQHICAFCVDFVGRVFREDDESILVWTMGDGAHPRCRHYAVPVIPDGVTPTGVEVPVEGETGQLYVERMIETGNVETLTEIFGKTRAVLLAEKAVEVEDIYTSAGTLRALIDMDIDAVEAEKIRSRWWLVGAAVAAEELTDEE